VHVARISIEHSSANDLLTRRSLGGGERRQCCFKFGIGSDGKSHALDGITLVSSYRPRGCIESIISPLVERSTRGRYQMEFLDLTDDVVDLVARERSGVD
jgi:hypothetical protein